MGRGGDRSSHPMLRAIPDFRRDVALKYVKRGYHLLCTHALTLLAIPLAATGTVAVIGCVLLLTTALLAYLFSGQRPVYLVDFYCYRNPTQLCRDAPKQLPKEGPWKQELICMVSQKGFMAGTDAAGVFDEKAIDFQSKVIERGGLGDKTYLPECLIYSPPQVSLEAARLEAQEVIFTCVDNLLKAHKLKPQQIDILIVNCSLFNPTPSLSAMVINHFKMRTNIHSYNLGGMGCSAGVISIALARELLQVYPNSRCLVVSTENITQNWYFGNQRSMLIPNCLFRVGGAAILLSNRWQDRWRAKYQLSHVVRTHMGRDDLAYGCVHQVEDDKGTTGVHLSKELMAIAGHSLKANITTLGPLVLPISEQLLFFINLVARKVFKVKTRPYIPDFKLAFEHFCIHTGGRGVIDEIEKQLQLSPHLVRPSRETLHRFGNTSSSSIWYVLSNIESKRGVRRGDRVWQIAFGSGFKCNSAVWKALRSSNEPHWAWEDTLHETPEFPANLH